MLSTFFLKCIKALLLEALTEQVQNIDTSSTSAIWPSSRSKSFCCLSVIRCSFLSLFLFLFLQHELLSITPLCKHRQAHPQRNSGMYSESETPECALKCAECSGFGTHFRDVRAPRASCPVSRKYPIAAHTFEVLEFSISQSPKTKNICHLPLLAQERLEYVTAHQDLRGYHL